MQKIKKFDVQSWGVQLKSQRDLRQGEGGKADNLKVALDYEGRKDLGQEAELAS